MTNGWIPDSNLFVMSASVDRRRVLGVYIIRLHLNRDQNSPLHNPGSPAADDSHITVDLIADCLQGLWSQIWLLPILPEFLSSRRAMVLLSPHLAALWNITCQLPSSLAGSLFNTCP